MRHPKQACWPGFDVRRSSEAGAVNDSLSFSFQPCEGSVNNNLALCALNRTGLAKQPRSAGGFVAPVTCACGVVCGKERECCLGGFNGTLLASWSEDCNMIVSPVDVDVVLITHSSSTAILEVRAVDLNFDDNATTLSLSHPSNCMGVGFEFFEARTGCFGLL